MSAFKAQNALLGNSDSDDDDDDDDADDAGAVDEEVDKDEASEDDDGDEVRTLEGRDGQQKRGQRWLEANFIKTTRTATGGTCYKSQLLPDKVFFSREKLEEFLSGKKYKRLKSEMKKGMRTHEDNQRLEGKAIARRERQRARKEQQRTDKKRQRRVASDADAIQSRQQKFQEKKARRLARRAANASGEME